MLFFDFFTYRDLVVSEDTIYPISILREKIVIVLYLNTVWDIELEQ